MKYFHGSRFDNIDALLVEKSNDGFCWLTGKYEFALLYAANSVRFWGYNKKTQKLVLREAAPNSLKIMYDKKKCYIYCAEEESLGEFEKVDYERRQAVKCKQNIKLKLFEVVDNAYEKFMEMYKNGEIEIKFLKDMTEEERQKDKEETINTFSPVMEKEFKDFPHEYKLLTELFPELKLENISYVFLVATYVRKYI
ncbi:MAG: hypothetical protein MJ149_00695 [Clostridia bacterium]|nr:hypothetical protein [Clostridia bacterium]